MSVSSPAQLMDLNLSQQEAVKIRDRHLLIVAGPGTGKTQTLTCRCAALAQELSPQERILALTFTNRAAEEMRVRLSRLGVDLSMVIVGTFHQLGLHILRQKSAMEGLSDDFKIFNPDYILSLSASIWPGDHLKERRRKLEKISNWKSQHFYDSPPPELTAYRHALIEAGGVDFDDLLIKSFYLLDQCEDTQRVWLDPLRHVLVDEYQDINAIQQTILKSLVRDHVTLTAIGDPNQAIYGFRGSDVRYFESFEKDFPKAETLQLTDNYRSAKNIISASGQIMSGTSSRYVPDLTARIYVEGRLIVKEALTDRAEAEYVVHQIEKLVGGTSMFSQDSGRVVNEEESTYTFGDIAVLYRLNNQHVHLKTALERSGIPFEVFGLKNCEDKDKEAGLDDICPRREEDVPWTGEKVALMSLHASKGLEFPVVFIVGCEDGLLPLNVDGLQSQKEEERRLFYVGMTRSKERLYLTSALRRQVFGKTREFKPSPFLADIKNELKSFDRQQKKIKVKSTETQLDLF